MGNYNPKITISSAPGVSNNLVVALAEATSPLVFVAYQVLTPPHSASVQLVFSSLNPVMHNVTIFQTSGILPAGTVRANFALDPRYPAISYKLPVWNYCGTTSGFAVNGNSITNSDWVGWNARLEIRGVGNMDPVLETSWDPTTGTITEIQVGYAAQLGEVWVVSFDPITVTLTPISSATALFSAIQMITANYSVLVADLGKAFIFQSVLSTAPIATLPDISTVPDNRPYYFISQGGAHKNAIIRCSGTDNIYYGTGVTTQKILGQGEVIWIFAATTPLGRFWFVINASDTNIKSVGQIIYSYDIADQNTMAADGTTQLRSVFPRLWEKVQSLDSSMLVNDTNWLNVALNNKARYSSGDGSTTFRFPLLYNWGFLRVVDGSARKAGSFQDLALLNHKHDSLIGNFPGAPNGSGVSKPSGQYNGTHSAITDLSSPPTDSAGAALTTVSTTENRPANSGIYALIRI